MNERLKNAMAGKHIDITTIANAAEVDPKTVQRWVSGRVPHTKHRFIVAQILDERADYLWPDDNSDSDVNVSQTAEVIAAYGRRADVPINLWWDLFCKSNKCLDILGFAVLFLPEQHPGLVDLLKAKALHGCKIRIAMADPDGEQVKIRDLEENLGGSLPGRIRNTWAHFKPLSGCENVSIGYHTIPLYNSVFRFDEEMFATPHMYGLHGSKAPLFHLRKLSQHGVFANFAEHFEHVWSTVTLISPAQVAVTH